MRKAHGEWILRTNLMLLIFDKENNKFLCATGSHNLNWDSKNFETGYWIRDSKKGNGVITESTNAILRFTFEYLSANKVIIKLDVSNLYSRIIPEKLNFKSEDIIKKDRSRYREEGITKSSDTAIYSRISINDLPRLKLSYIE